MIPAMASEASTDVLRSSRNAIRAAVANTASICDNLVE
jgi:gamma-glutamyltranspeptidase